MTRLGEVFKANYMLLAGLGHGRLRFPISARVGWEQRAVWDRLHDRVWDRLHDRVRDRLRSRVREAYQSKS